MSYLTRHGQSFIPTEMEVPYDSMELTVCANNKYTLTFFHKDKAVYERSFSGVFIGDRIRMGNMKGAIPIKVTIE